MMIKRDYVYSGKVIANTGYKIFSGSCSYTSFLKNPHFVYQDLLKQTKQAYKSCEEVHILFFQKI